jgi:hypothetical protein
MVAIESPEVRMKTDAFSPLRLFLVKVCVVTIAAIVFVYFSLAIIMSTVQDRFSSMGGPNFWLSLESQLDKLARQPDLPPEKKQKLIADIRAISAKYRPYIDAMKE